MVVVLVSWYVMSMVTPTGMLPGFTGGNGVGVEPARLLPPMYDAVTRKVSMDIYCVDSTESTVLATTIPGESDEGGAV